MKKFCETEAMFFELITRILCDTPPQKVDLAYLFGETTDNELSVINRGAYLWHKGAAEKIGISANGPSSGYRGAEAWFSMLCERNVKKENIIKIELAPDFPPSTDAEATGLIRFVRRKRWNSILIVASPFHQVRAFISTVSAMFREKGRLPIYNWVGESWSQYWLQYVTYSQNLPPGIRKDFFAPELSKIEKYHKKGDLVSAKEILSYLNQGEI